MYISDKENILRLDFFKMTAKFEDLDTLLEEINMNMRRSEISSGRVILQGEYYNKEFLSALGKPVIIRPSTLGKTLTEPDCEMYTATYGNDEKLVAVLPVKDISMRRDAREPVFALRSELVDYLISCKIGYHSFKELSFPDEITVMKSNVRFPTQGFEEMGHHDVVSWARKIGYHLFCENYSLGKDTTDRFTGWKRSFAKDIYVAQIKAEKDISPGFNPLYFLVIERSET